MSEQKSMVTAILEKAGITVSMREQFERYAGLLQEWNERMNLTTITDPAAIAYDHFLDSLVLLPHIERIQPRGCVDIGSGAGFPGLAIKIARPDLFMVLIEVNKKKVRFLRTVIAELQLKNIEIYDQDWRTFLRTSAYPVDLFCARASLSMSELIRMFKVGCRYREATLVYWASRHWRAETDKIAHLVREQHSYTIGSKQRQLVVLKAA